MLRNTSEEYGSIHKFLHWFMAMLIIFMLFCGYLMVESNWYNYHKITGLTILTLAIIRLIWALSNSKPKYPEKMAKYDKTIADIVLVLLYVCMLLIPLSGWLMATTHGQPPHIGNFYLPFPGVPVDIHLGSIFFFIHNKLVIVLIVLLVMHLIGVIQHHFIHKDNILIRMLPSCCKSAKKK